MLFIFYINIRIVILALTATSRSSRNTSGDGFGFFGSGLHGRLPSCIPDDHCILHAINEYYCRLYAKIMHNGYWCREDIPGGLEDRQQLGRAACREGVCHVVKILVEAV